MCARFTTPTSSNAVISDDERCVVAATDVETGPEAYHRHETERLSQRHDTQLKEKETFVICGVRHLSLVM